LTFCKSHCISYLEANPCLGGFCFMEISVFDLQKFVTATTPQTRKAASLPVLLGFLTHGHVHIINHGIDRDLGMRALRGWRKYADLPNHAADSRPDTHYQVGVSGETGTETAQDGAEGKKDHKLFYFFNPHDELGIPDELRDMFPALMARNHWPLETPDTKFKTPLMEYGQGLQFVAEVLIRAFAVALDLPETFFLSLLEHAPHKSRPLFYRPIPKGQEENLTWGGAHMDVNVLTLLGYELWIDEDGAESYSPPDEHGGLWIQDTATGQLTRPDNRPEGALTGQVGMMLEVLTGGYVKATSHTIVPPQVSGYSRAMMAHFMHMNLLQLVAPMRHFSTPESLRHYGPPIIAGTFLLKILQEIGLAPGAIKKLGFQY